MADQIVQSGKTITINLSVASDEKKIQELDERLKRLEAIFYPPSHIRPDGKDELYDKAKEVVIKYQSASASLLQRKLVIGYARAARIMDELRAGGVIGPATGASTRKVLIKST